MWPTPVSQDDNKTPEAHLAMKARMKGGPRSQITSLQVMVKATDRGLWPTPRAGKTTDEEEETWLVRWAEGKVATPPLTLAVKMWPTPRVCEGLRSSGANRTEFYRAMWPTPRSTMSSPTVKPSTDRTHETGGPPKRLEDEVARRLWPTPKSEPSGPDFARVDREQSGGDDLATAVARLDLTDEGLFTTPCAKDTGHHSTRYQQGGRPLSGQVGGSLNPDFVAWLMGWPRGWDSLEPLADAAFEEDPWRDGEWPGVPRIAKGVPDRVNRLRMLGNGWVPQCAAVIGRRIMAATRVSPGRQRLRGRERSRSRYGNAGRPGAQSEVR